MRSFTRVPKIKAVKTPNNHDTPHVILVPSLYTPVKVLHNNKHTPNANNSQIEGRNRKTHKLPTPQGCMKHDYLNILPCCGRQAREANATRKILQVMSCCKSCHGCFPPPFGHCEIATVDLLPCKCHICLDSY